MQSFPLFTVTSPSNPSHSDDRSVVYYYFIAAVAALTILLVALNMAAAGCCTAHNLVQGITNYLRSLGLLSCSPKDNGISRLIPSSRYRKEKEGAIDGDDIECSVCLMAFKNGEEVRKMPKCKHLFHAPCIDMWLYSHSNCPMCRANVLPEVTGASEEASQVTSV